MYNTHCHAEQDILITDIFLQIAKERNKSLERVKRLLLIEENRAVNRRFWELLDKKLLDHPFTYVGCCAECGQFKLL